MSQKIGRNDPCWCQSGRKYKVCHQAFDEKIARIKDEGHIVPDHDIIKTPRQIAGIKESAKINIAVLDDVAAKIHAGMSTEEIDRLVHEKTTAMGGIPATLHYHGFPKDRIMAWCHVGKSCQRIGFVEYFTLYGGMWNLFCRAGHDSCVQRSTLEYPEKEPALQCRRQSAR